VAWPADLPRLPIGNDDDPRTLREAGLNPRHLSRRPYVEPLHLPFPILMANVAGAL